MNLTGGIVLFAVLWFLALFVALQIGVRSQDDDGAWVPGTPKSAPANFNFRRKALIATVAAAVLWSVIATVILGGYVTLADIDWFGHLTSKPIVQ
ncbi:DUF1467 family protein [Albidovulum sp.]|uniref:DUF1467 family protein n=1 Tax=Albidovulum sp. TaxID=1872424 RepID=UPI001D9BAAB5|nr:DUF1467 family protein [Paracoccaceae bacterium]